jgi:DNA repair photolyase
MGIVKAKGNMYPWVTHMHSHLRGACSHACPYCYVQAIIGRRFGGTAHTGPLIRFSLSFNRSH